MPVNNQQQQCQSDDFARSLLRSSKAMLHTWVCRTSIICCFSSIDAVSSSSKCILACLSSSDALPNTHSTWSADAHSGSVSEKMYLETSLPQDVTSLKMLSPPRCYLPQDVTSPKTLPPARRYLPQDAISLRCYRCIKRRKGHKINSCFNKKFCYCKYPLFFISLNIFERVSQQILSENGANQNR